MSSVSTTTRRTRAGMMMLAAILVLAAAIMPACGSLCCANEADTAINAVMPCCDTQPRLERSEPLRITPTLSASVPAHVAAPVVIVERSPSRAVIAAPLPDRHDPSPPLFLRNAQLLI